MSLVEGTRLRLLAPVNKIYDENYDYLLTELKNKGFRKFMINSEIYDIKNKIYLEENKTYRIEVIVDEFSVNKKNYEQIVSIIEKGLEVGQNIIRFEIVSKDISIEEIKVKCFK